MNTARRRLLALLVFLAPLVPPASTRPAFAHHGGGGPVRLYLGSVRLEPRAEEWELRAALNNAETGKPAPGYLVQVTGTGPQGATFGPDALRDDDADGHYDGALGRLAPGDWSVTIDVGDVPGGDGYLIPISRAWPVRLQADQPVELIEEGSSSGVAPSSSSGADNFTPVLLVACVAAVLGVSATWLTRRKRAMLPAR